MDRTPNLDFPYIMPSQAQKHVTHNETIRMLDAVVHIGVISRTKTTAPDAPADGDRYLVASGATGDWVGYTSAVAAWQDGAWAFYAPKPGWIAWVGDEQKLVAWDGSQWLEQGGTNQFDTIGIGGATADAQNRIASNAAATLLNHDGDDHRLKINKNDVGDTASVVFQTGFSGRAEFGLAGDDNWRVKVSADGSAWREALTVDAGTGNIGAGVSAPSTRLHLDGAIRVGTYTVASAPSASDAGAGSIIFVSDVDRGAQIVFSDGSAWRRVTDRKAMA